MPNNFTFRDISASFAPNPVTGDVSVVLDEDAIKQSIRNIITTSVGEYFHQAKRGSPVYGALFEPLTPITKFDLEKSIRQTLNNYEPRAIILEVKVSDDPDRNSMSITITFRIKSVALPVTFTFLLSRVR